MSIERKLLDTKIQARNLIDSAMDDVEDNEGIMVFVASTKGAELKTSMTTFHWSHNQTSRAIAAFGEMIDNDRKQLISATVEDLPEADL